jgi:hypothetical protein
MRCQSWKMQSNSSSIWTVGWRHAVVDSVAREFVRGKENYKRAPKLFPNFDERQPDDFGQLMLSINRL